MSTTHAFGEDKSFCNRLLLSATRVWDYVREGHRGAQVTVDPELRTSSVDTTSLDQLIQIAQALVRQLRAPINIHTARAGEKDGDIDVKLENKGNTRELGILQVDIYLGTPEFLKVQLRDLSAYIKAINSLGADGVSFRILQLNARKIELEILGIDKPKAPELRWMKKRIERWGMRYLVSGDIEHRMQSSSGKALPDERTVVFGLDFLLEPQNRAEVVSHETVHKSTDIRCENGGNCGGMISFGSHQWDPFVRLNIHPRETNSPYNSGFRSDELEAHLVGEFISSFDDEKDPSTGTDSLGKGWRSHSWQTRGFLNQIDYFEYLQSFLVEELENSRTLPLKFAFTKSGKVVSFEKIHRLEALDGRARTETMLAIVRQRIQELINIRSSRF
jgi:hypothetical protein